MISKEGALAEPSTHFRRDRREAQLHAQLLRLKVVARRALRRGLFGTLWPLHPPDLGWAERQRMRAKSTVVFPQGLRAPLCFAHSEICCHDLFSSSIASAANP
jgi:hypothetical protein